MARKTKVSQAQEDIGFYEAALAKYDAEHADLGVELKRLEEEKTAAYASYTAASTVEAEVRSLALTRLKLKNEGGNGRSSYWHPDFIAAVEAVVGVKHADAESLRPGNNRHGHNPFEAALHAICHRTIEADPVVKVASQRCRRAYDAQSEAANKLWRTGRDRAVLMTKVRDAQRELEQAQYEAEERQIERAAKSLKGTVEAEEAANKEKARVARGILTQLTDGNLKVEW